MKVVISKSIGGFNLSPEAILWLYERKSSLIDSFSAIEYYQYSDDNFGLQFHLNEWRQYQETKKQDFDITVFSPDEQLVLFVNYCSNRSDPLLIQVVEEMEEKANGYYADLKIVVIEDNVEYEIDQRDGGPEWIAEKHRVWG